MMETDPEEMKSVVLHEEVHKEKASVKTVESTEGAVWGLASNHKAPLTAEERDPG
jgi:hypothetical protein